MERSLALFREYMDKVKQLEKYIEPLRRMITKIGTEDQVRSSKCHLE